MNLSEFLKISIDFRNLNICKISSVNVCEFNKIAGYVIRFSYPQIQRNIFEFGNCVWCMKKKSFNAPLMKKFDLSTFIT